MNKLKKVVLILSTLLLVSIGIITFILSDNNLRVHYIDVGQGDAILIQTSKGENVLIDGGDRWNSVADKLLAYLQEHGVEKIDAIISTHPHADHIGGLTAVINRFPVEAVYDSGRVHTSATYENYLLLIDKKDIPFYTPRVGDYIELEDISFLVLHPDKENIENYSINNASIVLHLQYGEISFLFTGDIEYESEEKLLQSGFEIDSNILKVAHHGSKSSTHQAFLELVSPEIAIIQVGENNRYAHPSSEIIDRLQKSDVDIYRNDLHGDIVITTDGKDFSIETSLEKDPNISEIKESNKININTASADQLQQLNGVGPVISERIIKYRKEKGPFKSNEEIKYINGINQSVFNRWKGDIKI